MFDVYHGTGTAPEYLTNLCSRCDDQSRLVLMIISTRRLCHATDKDTLLTVPLLLQDLLRGTYFQFLSGTPTRMLLFVVNSKLIFHTRLTTVFVQPTLCL